jgi:hypothetical protein
MLAAGGELPVVISNLRLRQEKLGEASFPK